MVDLLPQPKPPREDPEREFVAISHGRPHFAVLLRQLLHGAKKSVVVVGDRLFLARLRNYDDIVQTLATHARTLPVRILVPDNVVDLVDGRRVRMDELADQIRRLPVPLGDVTIAVRDQEEYLVTRFLPNDLHPSRGSDRVEMGHDTEIAALWQRMAQALWDQAKPWAAARSG